MLANLKGKNEKKKVSLAYISDSKVHGIKLWPTSGPLLCKDNQNLCLDLHLMLLWLVTRLMDDETLVSAFLRFHVVFEEKKFGYLHHSAIIFCVHVVIFYVISSPQ